MGYMVLSCGLIFVELTTRVGSSTTFGTKINLTLRIPAGYFYVEILPSQ
jgi:hypothetical protein